MFWSEFLFGFWMFSIWFVFLKSLTTSQTSSWDDCFGQQPQIIFSSMQATSCIWIRTLWPGSRRVFLSTFWINLFILSTRSHCDLVHTFAIFYQFFITTRSQLSWVLLSWELINIIFLELFDLKDEIFIAFKYISYLP